MTLYDKYNNQPIFQRSDKADNYEIRTFACFLSQLFEVVKNGAFFLAAPENIEISERGEINISTEPPLNIYYASPEIILDEKNPSKTDAFFSLGLIIYFIIYGKSYYENMGIEIIKLPELKMSGKSLINFEISSEKNFLNSIKEAMCRLTSWEESSREAGFKLIAKEVRIYVPELVVNDKNERCLYIMRKGDNCVRNVFKLGEVDKKREIEFSRMKSKEFTFFVGEKNADLLNLEKVFFLNVELDFVVERDVNYTDYRLKINYYPEGDVEIRLIDREGHSLSDQVQRFSV